MISHTTHSPQIGNKGFTLIELMVTLAIVSIIMATLGTLFANTSRVFTQQMATGDLQQEIRSTLDVISQYVRLAGYSAYGNSTTFKIETAGPTELKFSADLDNNDTKSTTTNFNNCEIFTFIFTAGTSSVQMRCSNNTETLIGGAGVPTQVTNFSFDYRNANDAPTTTISEMQSVIITLRAQTPAGRAGMVQRSYSTKVAFRNKGN